MSDRILASSRHCTNIGVLFALFSFVDFWIDSALEHCIAMRHVIAGFGNPLIFFGFTSLRCRVWYWCLIDSSYKGVLVSCSVGFLFEVRVHDFLCDSWKAYYFSMNIGLGFGGLILIWWLNSMKWIRVDCVLRTDACIAEGHAPSDGVRLYESSRAVNKVDGLPRAPSSL